MIKPPVRPDPRLMPVPSEHLEPARTQHADRQALRVPRLALHLVLEEDVVRLIVGRVGRARAPGDHPRRHDADVRTAKLCHPARGCGIHRPVRGLSSHPVPVLLRGHDLPRRSKGHILTATEAEHGLNKRSVGGVLLVDDGDPERPKALAPRDERGDQVSLGGTRWTIDDLGPEAPGRLDGQGGEERGESSHVPNYPPRELGGPFRAQLLVHLRQPRGRRQQGNLGGPTKAVSNAHRSGRRALLDPQFVGPALSTAPPKPLR